MLVVIDTNQVVSDFLLDSARWREFLQSVEAGRFDLRVPECVVDEVESVYRKCLRNIRRAAKAAIKDSRIPMREDELLQPVLASEESLNGEVEKYRRRLLERLREAGGAGAPVPLSRA